jgi:hypothetical protein
MGCHIFGENVVTRGYKTDMSALGSYHLGKRVGDTEFSSARVYRISATPFKGPYDEFLVGEPVGLKNQTYNEDQTSEERIWWIHEFIEIDGEGKAEVCGTRERTPGHFLVSVLLLEKLNAMERLAVEYAF